MDEAIVLKKKRILGTDSVVILLTQTRGKISAIAKGIHAPTSRRIAALQTGNLIHYDTHKKTGTTLYLTQAELISHFSSIKKQEQGLRSDRKSTRLNSSH